MTNRDKLVNLRTAVNSYVTKGWRPFPVEAGGKKPARAAWQVSDDPWPGWFVPYNVGIPTGKRSGVVVLDIDEKSGGYDSLAKMEKTYGAMSDTRRCLTANGGVHYYFRAPSVEVRNTVRLLGFPGVDFRGDGGYVVLPPSVLANGGEYLWDVGSPEELADAPGWLIDRPRPAAVEVGEEEFFPEGTRNESLFRVACAIRRFGLPYGTILRWVTEVNETKCNPPLSAGEVELIVKSSVRYEPSFDPRGGASRPSGDSGNAGRSPDVSRLFEGRPFRRAGAPRSVRSGAWYLGNRGKGR